MKTLHLETTAPFQGLPELVADAEGLFAKEGLEIVWEDVDAGVDRIPQIHVSSPQNLNPFHSHGRLLEQGKADMYNACEWGNYCRVQDTRVGSRQIGRRGIVTYAAIAVRPNSPIYTPQQLANRSVGVPFYFGGTSLLIVVSVTLDTVTQIQAHLLAHQYEGLIKKARLRGRGR